MLDSIMNYVYYVLYMTYYVLILFITYYKSYLHDI